MPKKPAFQARRQPVQQRSRVTVEAICQAAARVLIDEGYERATTNRIAQVAGVSIGTLYQYFDGREAVFDAVVTDVLDRVMEAAAAALTLPPSRGLDVRLRALSTAVLKVLAEQPSVLRQLDAIPRSSFRTRLRAAKARARELLEALMAEHAHELGVADAALASRILTDVGEGLIYNLQADDDVERLAEQGATLAGAYLAAVSRR